MYPPLGQHRGWCSCPGCDTKSIQTRQNDLKQTLPQVLISPRVRNYLNLDAKSFLGCCSLGISGLSSLRVGPLTISQACMKSCFQGIH